MIVLEGSDLTGKTTLMRELKERFTWAETAHLGLPPKGRRHWDVVRENLLFNPFNTIYDRMVLGSWVFRQIKPDEYNKDGVTDDELGRWMALIWELRTTVVRCWADQDTLRSRFADRGDTYVDCSELLKSANMYNGLFLSWYRSVWSESGAYYPVITYDSTRQTPGEFIHDHRFRFQRDLEPSFIWSASESQAIRRLMS